MWLREGTTKHCLSIFILIYCQLQLRLSLRAKEVPHQLKTVPKSVPVDVEATRFGSKLYALVIMLDTAFCSSFSKSLALLDPVLGVQISCKTIATIRRNVWYSTGALLERSIHATGPRAATSLKKLRCCVPAPKMGKVSTCMPSHLNLRSWSLIQHA